MSKNSMSYDFLNRDFRSFKINEIESDHRLKLRIYEAKDFFHCNKADSFCVITANYMSKSGKSIVRPNCNVSTPLIRRMNNAFVGNLVKKGSYTSTIIDKNTLEMLANQEEKNEKKIQFETKIQPCNSNPFWGEYFEIILNPNFYSVKIELFLKNALVNVPVGEMYLYKYDLEQYHLGEAINAWKPLNSKNASIKKEVNDIGHSHIFEVINDWKTHDCIVCENIIWDEGITCSQCHITCHIRCSRNLCNCEACGSLRIEYRYIDFPILPLRYYDALQDLIIDEKMNVVNLISKSCDSKDEAAREIVTILNEGNLALPFLSYQCKLEIANTKIPETLFRGSSFCTKGVDYYMKLICKNYLENTVGVVIKKIIKQHKECEIDPRKLHNESGEYIDDRNNVPKVPKENIENLKEFAKAVFDSIIEYAEHFPMELRELFNNIQEYSCEKFPDSRDINYTSITAFVFLRLFSPAIINPQFYGIIDENLKAREVRTLTLISKFVQQTANLVPYKKTKEGYMSVLNDLIDEYIPLIKGYITSITRIKRKSVIKPKKIAFTLFKKKTNGKIEEKDKLPIDIGSRFSSLHRIINKNLENIKKEVDKNNSNEEIEAYNELKDIIENLNDKAGLSLYE